MVFQGDRAMTERNVGALVVEESTMAYTAEFRSLMAGFPTGVGIVTAYDTDGRPWGMTCSSICSVTLRPPTLLVCLRRGSPTLNAMIDRSAFALNLLHEQGRRAAELFASGDPDRFQRIRWLAEPDFAGPHLVGDAHAVADCRVSRQEQVGDHIVVFGEVYRVTIESAHDATAPLLYGRRQYAAWPAG